MTRFYQGFIIYYTLPMVFLHTVTFAKFPFFFDETLFVMYSPVDLHCV